MWVAPCDVMQMWGRGEEEFAARDDAGETRTHLDVVRHLLVRLLRSAKLEDAKVRRRAGGLLEHLGNESSLHSAMLPDGFERAPKMDFSFFLPVQNVYRVCVVERRWRREPKITVVHSTTGVSKSCAVLE